MLTLRKAYWLAEKMDSRVGWSAAVMVVSRVAV